MRLRLLTSYLVLILVTLGVIALALIVLISNRAAPPQPTYERLAALTQGLNYIDAIADIAGGSQSAVLAGGKYTNCLPSSRGRGT